MSRRERHRLWLERLARGPLSLGGASAHYLRDVLRLGPGDELTLLGGDGHRATAVVRAVSADAVLLEVGELEAAPASGLELTVALPAPKGERADWAVEKLTELGVTRIAWITTERSIVVPNPAGQRASRWQRLAEAAAKQAGRARTPAIVGPHDLDETLRWAAETRYIGSRGGIPLVHELAVSAPGASAILLVGPEGGFTEAELSRARASGYIGVGLGLHTLRMETAAIAGAAILLCGGADGSMPERAR